MNLFCGSCKKEHCFEGFDGDVKNCPYCGQAYLARVLEREKIRNEEIDPRCFNMFGAIMGGPLLGLLVLMILLYAGWITLDSRSQIESIALGTFGFIFAYVVTGLFLTIRVYRPYLEKSLAFRSPNEGSFFAHAPESHGREPVDESSTTFGKVVLDERLSVRGSVPDQMEPHGCKAVGLHKKTSVSAGQGGFLSNGSTPD